MLVQAPVPVPAVAPAAPPSAEPAKDAKPEEPKDDGSQYGFTKRFLRGYPFLRDLFPEHLGKNEAEDPNAPEPPPAPRRGLAAPFGAPFAATEWQATPVPGNPLSTDNAPLLAALYGIPGCGDWMKENRIRINGWLNGSTNWSTNKSSNAPDSNWLRANRLELDQAVIRFEREVDSVQTDHIAWGFRSCFLYGQDYRYTTAGGWGSDQLFAHNHLYGFDPIEQYVDIYVPHLAEGCIFRIGRWLTTPDIETQLAPDNYMGSRSLLFTQDTYTQTGALASIRLNDSWLVQAGFIFGADMAPWYKGAAPSGFFGCRWISKSNKDSIYTCLNQINNAQYRHFIQDGVPAGHDNYNNVVSTWQHKFTDYFLTKTEGYFMWQRNAVLGGGIIFGPVREFGGGVANAPTLPGTSLTYGVVNFTEYALNKKDFLSFRNECWRDERGMRSGFPGTYTSHAIGLSHSFNSTFQVRPEVGYYRNWTAPAFDNGLARGAWIAGMDFTIRF